jgi:methylmalonyl-CoA mutase cobalamin-binding domain/chain
MSTDRGKRKLRHPIGVVARRTGLAQDLIRAWERRYGVVEPERTETGRRLYTDEDVRVLLLLKRLVDGGRRISDVAGMPLATLEKLASEDREAAVTPTVAAPPDGQARLEAAVDAATQLDRGRLEGILAEAALSMSAPEMRQKLIAPLLMEIGERWRKGAIRVAHEHLATSIVRAFVDGMRNRSTNGNNRPRILIATTAGQRHELGALMAAAAAEEVGWEAIYLGASLPAEEIGAAARQSNAFAVGLSMVFRDDVHMVDELRAIRRYLSREVALVVGGRATEALEDILEEIGAYRVTDMLAFQTLLDDIRGRTE